jgi:hypothetical protein
MCEYKLPLRYSMAPCFALQRLLMISVAITPGRLPAYLHVRQLACRAAFRLLNLGFRPPSILFTKKLHCY